MRRILCIYLPPGSVKDLAALARLAEHCERYSPIVGWETVEAGARGQESGVGRRVHESAADEMHQISSHLFLDVTGIGVLFGGEEILARTVVADLTHLGYEARVGVADTIGAAWAAAQLRIADCGMAKPVLST